MVTFTVNIDGISPTLLALIGQQFQDLPMVLQSVSLNLDNGTLRGSIVANVFGS